MWFGLNANLMYVILMSINILKVNWVIMQRLVLRHILIVVHSTSFTKHRSLSIVLFVGQWFWRHTENKNPSDGNLRDKYTHWTYTHTNIQQQQQKTRISLKDKRQTHHANCAFLTVTFEFRPKKNHTQHLIRFTGLFDWIVCVVTAVVTKFYVRFSLIYCYCTVFGGHHAKENYLPFHQTTMSFTRSLIWGFNISYDYYYWWNKTHKTKEKTSWLIHKVFIRQKKIGDLFKH